MGSGFTYQYQDSGSERSVRRRMRLLGRIRTTCPHIHFIDISDDGGDRQMAVEYAFETFFGTLHYFCMMCGSKWSQHSIDVFQRKLTAAVEHDFVGTARNILEDTKKHQKLMRKLNRLGGPPT